jgi:hypothetical protein
MTCRVWNRDSEVITAQPQFIFSLYTLSFGNYNITKWTKKGVGKNVWQINRFKAAKQRDDYLED